MTAKRKLLLFLVLPLLALGGCGYCAYRGIQEAFSIRTSSEARPEEVSFLHLPPTASHIGYWSDGINRCAEFDIPEDAFRHLFREFQLREITEPITVRPQVFGNPEVFPLHVRTEPVTVSNGLRYSVRWSNGGGYNIVYDRSSSRAYYEYSAR